MNTKMKGKLQQALITNNCNIDACFKIQKLSLQSKSLNGFRGNENRSEGENVYKNANLISLYSIIFKLKKCMPRTERIRTTLRIRTVSQSSLIFLMHFLSIQSLPLGHPLTTAHLSYQNL